MGFVPRAVVGLVVLMGATAIAHAAQPNIVLVFADDLGYGDLGCYGNGSIRTPHLDGLAKSGCRMTDFYVAQAVCGASRAALLSGCYPNRVSLQGAPDHRATHGIHAEESLLSELLKEQGYATAVVGKWHLGHRREFLPKQHGFDEYFGLPYSNDMWPFHPEAKGGYPPLPLVKGDETMETNPDQNLITRRYTDAAVDFIRRQGERPYFLYLAHTMPHVPLHVAAERRGKSAAGLFGDVVEEIDASTGELLEAIRTSGQESRTWVIFASDNGPWLSYGNHAGSAGPLREGKGTTWDGGVRVPCVMRYPGRIPAGTVATEPTMTIDVLPSVAAELGLKLPNRRIDGHDARRAWFADESAPRLNSTYFFYWGKELQAVRHGDWKLHFRHEYRTLATNGADGVPGKYRNVTTEPALYHLRDDAGELKNVMPENPRVVAEIEALANAMRADLGDSLTKTAPTGARPAGHVSP